MVQPVRHPALQIGSFTDDLDFWWKMPPVQCGMQGRGHALDQMLDPREGGRGVIGLCQLCRDVLAQRLAQVEPEADLPFLQVDE